MTSSRITSTPPAYRPARSTRGLSASDCTVGAGGLAGLLSGSEPAPARWLAGAAAAAAAASARSAFTVPRPAPRLRPRMERNTVLLVIAWRTCATDSPGNLDLIRAATPLVIALAAVVLLTDA